MKIGVSTACLYPRPTEDALEAFLQAGVKTLEVFLNTDRELEPTFLYDLRRRCDDYGARVVSIHPFSSVSETFYFFTNYPRRFEDGVEQYKRFFSAAQILGADIIVFHGAVAEMPLSSTFYVERFGRLWEVANEMGVMLAHENVCRCKGNSPAFFQMLHVALPQVKFVLDLKQAIRSGSDVESFLSVMGPHLCHVHVSDHDDAHDCMVPGKGQMDFFALCTRLDAFGYQNALIVELYADNHNGVAEIVQSLPLLFT